MMKLGKLLCSAAVLAAITVSPLGANLIINVDTAGPVDADGNAMVTVNNAQIFGGGDGIVRNADTTPLTVQFNGTGNIDVGNNGIQANTSLGGLTLQGGTITAGGVGVNHFNTLEGDFLSTTTIIGLGQNGIAINGVNGNFDNRGDVTGNTDAIIIYNVTTGNVSNSGTVVANNSGGVVTALIQGNFVNSGDVMADQQALNQYNGVNGNYTNQGNLTAMFSNGINIAGSGLGGNFFNSGTVDAGSQGFTIAGIGGNLTNTGDMTSNLDGINVYSGGVVGFVNNSGDITSGNNAFTIDGVGGHFNNSGKIIADNEGINIYGSGVAGNLVNTGDVEAGNNAINSAGVGGHFSNSGDLSGGTQGINIYSFGVTGNFTNTGQVTGLFDGMAIAGVGGNFVNMGDVAGFEQGINIYGAVGGDFLNMGSTVSSMNSPAINVVSVDGNFMIIDSIVTSEFDDAIFVGDIGGSVLFNPSTVTGNQNGVTFNGNIGGNITIQSGSVVTGTLQNGIRISATVAGDIINFGRVDGDLAGLFFDTGSLGGAVMNFGTFSSTSGNAISLGTGDFTVLNQGGTFTSGGNTVQKTADGETTIENNGGTFRSTGGEVFDLNGTSGPNTVTGNWGTFIAEGSRRVYNGANATVDTINDIGGTWMNGGGRQVISTRGGADVVKLLGTDVLRGDGPTAEVIDLANGADTYKVQGFAHVDGVVNGGQSDDTIVLELWGVDNATILAEVPGSTLNPDGTINLPDNGEGTFGKNLYSWINFENATAVGVNLATLDGLTPNQRAIGAALNPAFQGNPGEDFKFVLTEIVQQGTGGFANVANNLSPQRQGEAASNIIFNNASFDRRSLNNHIDRIFGDGFESGDTTSWSAVSFDARGLELIDPTQDLQLQRWDQRLASLGLSSGVASDVPGIVFGGLDLATDSKLMDPKAMIEAPLADPNRFGVWVAGQGIIADVEDADGDLQDFDYDTYDVSVGVDYRLTREFVLGLLFNYGSTDATLDGNGSSLDVDTYTGGLYAGFQSADDGWFGNAFVLGGASDYDQSRRIVFGGINRTALSDPDGWQITSGATGGYLFNLDRSGTWQAGPIAGVQYTYLEQDGYTETGAQSLNLNVASQDAESFRTALGAKLRGRWQVSPDFAIVPSVSAEWLHEFLDDSRGITAAFSDPAPGSFVVNTRDPDRDFGLVGLGLDFLVGEAWSAFLTYDAQFSDDYLGHSIGGGARFEF
ncbi:MAG: autotransporter outer membrane beta-barrel domain-containing protein [Verrucomicrobiota bacterium]